MIGNKNLFRRLIFLDGALPGVVRSAGGVRLASAVFEVPAVRGEAGPVRTAGQLAVLGTDQLVVTALSVDGLTPLIIHRVTGPTALKIQMNYMKTCPPHLPLEGVHHFRFLNVPADLTLCLRNILSCDLVVVIVVIALNTSPHCVGPAGTGTPLPRPEETPQEGLCVL